MKKKVSILLCVVFCIALFMGACSQGVGDTSSEEPKEQAAVEKAEKPVIGFSIMGMAAPYFVPVSENAIATGEKLGAEVVIYDAEFSSEKQTSQIKNMIAQGYDAIAFIPVDSQSLAPVLKEAKDAGIPTIDVNISLDPSHMNLVTSYVGYDMIQHGTAAGESMLEALGKEGGKIVEIQGVPGTESTRLKSKGFYDAVAANSNIEVVASRDASGDRAAAMAIMEDFLTKYQDLAGVYVHDDNMAVGAIQAIKAAGRLDEIKVVSIAGSIDGLEAVKAGELYSTVFQDPSWEGTKAIEVAMDIINGKEVEKAYTAISPAVSIDNADEFTALW